MSVGGGDASEPIEGTAQKLRPDALGVVPTLDYPQVHALEPHSVLPVHRQRHNWVDCQRSHRSRCLSQKSLKLAPVVNVPAAALPPPSVIDVAVMEARAPLLACGRTPLTLVTVSVTVVAVPLLESATVPAKVVVVSGSRT